MSKRYRIAQQIIKARRDARKVRRLWDVYGCSCGRHNMRGDW